ncbi:unnamed protein product [Orchesella dallaii]|uniref:Uncharacterized protein n=1 Tax=Orchesella dallaii TaxID=48710 RepID=A0ABP1Q9W3_9HEXA
MLAATDTRLYIAFLFILILFPYNVRPVSSDVTEKKPNSSTNGVKIAFTEELNSSLFYQTYMPLIYKFRIPEWSVKTLRLNKTFLCKNDEESVEDLCPVTYHLEELLKDFSEIMSFYKDTISASGGDFYEQNFSCDKIKPHFLHFSTQLGGLGTYLSEYKTRCSLGKNVTLNVKNVGSAASHHAVMAYERFKELHEESKDRKSAEYKFLQMTGYMAMQNSYLLSQYVDSIRWAKAFTICEAFRLDVGLMSPEMLNESLSEITETIFAAGFNFSLPTGGSLPHYYKLPLTDCMLTIGNANASFHEGDDILSPYNENITANLIVRLLVPVVKARVTYKLIKLNKVPYLLNENGGEKICEIRNFQPEDSFLIELDDVTEDITIVGKVSPYCSSSRLCKIPEVTHRHFVDPCIMGIITKNHSMTSESCSFECSSLPQSLLREHIFPIFTQLASNTYSVTGGVPMGIPYMLIMCNGIVTHMIHSNTSSGVILVTLPCSCQLAYGPKRFQAQEPCDEPLNVEHVIEFSPRHHHHRANTPSARENKENFDYIIETMDADDYNVSFFESKTLDMGDDFHSDKKYAPSQDAHCGHVLIWIFLVFVLLINVLTIFILYKHSIINFNSILCTGNTINISRLNEFPISNVTSNSNN